MSYAIFEALPDQHLMALCIYGEARNQGLDGMLAVGSVIMNRAKNPSWWGGDIKSVILKPQQFSCFNTDDPNFPQLVKMAGNFDEYLKESGVLRACNLIARGVIEGHLISNVGSATHYHTRQVKPSWGEKMQKLTAVGDHVFYA
jgi:spore germination cell wall hydrolase CwlJ-like protein